MMNTEEKKEETLQNESSESGVYLMGLNDP